MLVPSASVAMRHPPLPAGVQEQPPAHRLVGQPVQAQAGGEPAVEFVRRVFQVEHPGGGGVMHGLAEDRPPGRQRHRLPQRQRRLARPAGGGEDGDEAADQAGAVEPFARRDGGGVGQARGDGGERGGGLGPALPEGHG